MASSAVGLRFFRPRSEVGDEDGAVVADTPDIESGLGAIADFQGPRDALASGCPDRVMAAARILLRSDREADVGACARGGSVRAGPEWLFRNISRKGYRGIVARPRATAAQSPR